MAIELPNGSKVIKVEEEIFEVKPVGKRVRCPKCHLGYMNIDPTQQMFMTSPPLFPHRCDKCGATERYPKQYPTIEFEVVGEDNKEEDEDDNGRAEDNKTNSTENSGTNILL